jgi:signal transduction histidine kinase
MKSFLLCLVLCITTFSGITYAQNRIDYFRDTSKKLSAEAIAKKSFQSLHNNFINFGQDSANHWLRVHLVNNSAHHEKYFFEIDFVWLDSVYFYNQSFTLIKAMAWQTPFSERLYPHRNFVLPVLLKPHSDTTVYARFYKKRMLIKGEVSIKNEETFFSNRIFDTGYYSFFTGIIAIVFIFSMLIFFTNKDRVYLYYAFYVLFSLGFTLTGVGFFLPLYQQGIGFIIASELRNWMLWFSLVFLMLFIRNYVMGGHVLSHTNLIIWRIALGLLFSLIFQRIALAYFQETTGSQPYILLVIMICCFLLSIVLTFYFVVYSYIRKINTSLAKNYLIGITPFFIFGTLSYFRTFEFIEHSSLLSQEVQVACVVFDILVLMFGLTIRYRALHEEKEKQARLALENKLTLQYEKERISRDLHDSVGSQLTIVATSLDAATYLAHKQKLEPEKLEKINENVREAVQNLRDTIWATHQSRISLDNLDKRLRNYILKAIEDKLEVTIGFSFINPETTITSMQAINLFRVIQEAIQNILKHAQATEINISGQQTEEKISITISDNGVGMSDSAIKNTESYGIRNMKNRIHEINGELMIDSTADKGTIVSIQLPIYTAIAVLNGQ